VTAGISVGCLAFELTEDDLPTVIQAVQAAAKRVTDRLVEIGG
jgi:DNA-binding IclR family transcriptional regulator